VQAVPAHLGIGDQVGSYSYLCFIEPHKPRMWSGFRRVDTREQVAKLQQAMDKVLSDELSIREKRWWTFEEFNQPQRRSEQRDML
jgi:hypothetical protein